MNKDEIIKEIEAYWQTLENADEYKCGCSESGPYLNFVHCQSQFLKRGLIKHFLNEDVKK